MVLELPGGSDTGDKISREEELQRKNPKNQKFMYKYSSSCWLILWSRVEQGPKNPAEDGSWRLKGKGQHLTATWDWGDRLVLKATKVAGPW